MLEYQGPIAHVNVAKTNIATIGLNNIPKGPHRERMAALNTATTFEAVFYGTEAVYALLVDENVTLPKNRGTLLVEALLNLSRAALEWRVGGKIDRWVELQSWAWDIHNDREPSSIPKADSDLSEE